jgi:hypothetical protein
MPERLGTVSNAPIIADFSGGFGRPVDLILRKDYAREVLAAPRSHRLCKELVPAGSRITVYAPEARVLVEAGAAIFDHAIAAIGPDGAHGAVRLSDLCETLAGALADSGAVTELARALGPHLDESSKR